MAGVPSHCKPGKDGRRGEFDRDYAGRGMMRGAADADDEEAEGAARQRCADEVEPMGRQRRCHWIEGRVYDRLWFDLLASEHDPDRLAAALPDAAGRQER